MEINENEVIVGWIIAGCVIGVLLLILCIAGPSIFWTYRKKKYFNSTEFKNLRADVKYIADTHNEIVDYVEEILRSNAFELGSSSTGQYAHLANFQNTSHWKYRRDRHTVDYKPHIHNASLQIVRNASENPIKYLIKYFNISPTPATLADVQQITENIMRLEEAIHNLQQRESELIQSVNPPKFIRKRYAYEFWQHLNIRILMIKIPYPVYRFQYVSAGGNSAQTTDITLNTPTLEALAEVLTQKIRRTQSAAGQRALMTEALREFIKRRDNYTCQNCNNSTYVEPNLLLEVDHKIPVSKGGLSKPENLQTLCWRCNRTKGAQMPV